MFMGAVDQQNMGVFCFCTNISVLSADPNKFIQVIFNLLNHKVIFNLLNHI